MSDLITNHTEQLQSTGGSPVEIAWALHAGRDKDGRKKPGDGDEISPEPSDPSKWEDPVPAVPME